jgi:phosphocarrier protein
MSSSSEDAISADHEMERILTVTNKMGVHARPAAMIVRVSNHYDDVEVSVESNDEEVNGKSIMGLMMLAAGKGTKLRFTASGPRARKFLDEIEALFERKFDET